MKVHIDGAPQGCFSYITAKVEEVPGGQIVFIERRTRVAGHCYSCQPLELGPVFPHTEDDRARTDALEYAQVRLKLWVEFLPEEDIEWNYNSEFFWVGETSE